MASSKKLPLKFLCPCGYSKRLPAAFNGKKVVCPKCRKVLSVTKIEPARVLLQCPYCHAAQRYAPDVEQCVKCNGIFKPPTDDVPQPPPPQKNQSVVGEDASDFNLTVSSSSSAASSPRRKSKSAVIPALFYSTAPILAATLFWITSAERFGLPTFEEVVLGRGVKGIPASQTDSIAEAAHQTSIHEPIKLRQIPRLLSPSVRITGGGFEVDQVISQLDSIPAGFKTIITVGIQNLTDCKLTDISLEVKLLDQDGGSITETVDRELINGISPKGKNNLTIFASPGDWAEIAVTVLAVSADDQTDATSTEPFVIKNRD